MATVYAVASAKGGVGKTTTTAAVATLVADSGADVVAIDADLGMANLAAAAGVTPGGITLHDVLAGAAEPHDAVHEGPAGLRVVPGAANLDAYAAADPTGLRAVVDAFDDADYVFVDAGAGLSHDSTLPLGLADETLLVSTAERSALGDTEKTRQLTERLGGSVAGAAITRLDPATAADDDPIDAVEETLDAPVIGRIPEDDAVLRAAESTRPLPLFAPDAPATRAYRDLTRALTGAAIDGPGFAGGDDRTVDEGDEADGEGDPDDEADEIAEADVSADETEEGNEVDETDETDEDIIVADSERAGLGEPGDEEDIIVAAESPVEDVADADPAAATEDAAPGDSPERADELAPDDDTPADPEETDAVVGETETVGEDHVDGDDLEAMIEDDLGPEQFDAEGDLAAESAEDAASAADPPGDDAPVDGDPEADAPDETSDADGAATTETEPASNRAAETDLDDELVGSVPFRDDDTGTMNTALSEEDDEEDDDDGDEEEKDGGFFSRLFGR